MRPGQDQVRMAVSPIAGLEVVQVLRFPEDAEQVRMAVSPIAGLEARSLSASNCSVPSQNGGKPYCGIGSMGVSVAHAGVFCQNGGKPYCGIGSCNSHPAIERVSNVRMAVSPIAGLEDLLYLTGKL